MAKKPLSDEQKVRRNAKSLNMMLQDLLFAINRGSGTFDGEARIRGVKGRVRVIVRVRAPVFMKWAISVIYSDRARIDGIDWEGSVHDYRGKRHDCSGWHRHMWDPVNLDTRKECLPSFDPGKDTKEFILAGFAVLNIHLKKEVVSGANIALPFN